jgi:O-antigen ligase
VHGTVVGEAVDRVELNRGTVVLVLFFWPAAYAMYRDGLQRRIVTLFLLLLMAILVPNSSQTALVGLLLGAAVFFLCRIHARLVSRTIMALVVICFLAAPFLAQALYVQRDNLPPWKEAAMKQRVTIWKVVSDKIFEKPVAGWGYEATRNAASDVVKHVQPYRWKKVMHPHNMPLQVWVDFGAVGVAIAVFILLAIFLYLERLPATAFPFGFGLFSSALLMGSIGYGAWQSWWLGALGISAALVAALMPQRDG